MHKLAMVFLIGLRAVEGPIVKALCMLDKHLVKGNSEKKLKLLISCV